MAKIAGNEVRPGTMIEHQGQLWMTVKSQAVKPGKGGAYNQVELKNIETGTKLNERFRSSETVEEIHLDKKDFQFLYANGEALTFMDMENYEQIELQADFVGEQAQYLADGMKVMLRLHGRPPAEHRSSQAGHAGNRRGRSRDARRHRRPVLQDCGDGKRHEDSGATLC